MHVGPAEKAVKAGSHKHVPKALLNAEKKSQTRW